MDDVGLPAGAAGGAGSVFYCNWGMVMVHYRVCFFQYGFPIDNSWREWCSTLEDAEQEKEKAIYAGQQLDSNVDVRIIKVTEEIM